MKLSPTWLREFVDPQVDNHRLAEDLTAVGIAVESINGEGENTIFEMEIGTNRPDAMNHYGVAREASVIYNLGLKRIERKLPPTPAAKAVSLGGVGDTTNVVSSPAAVSSPFPIEIAEAEMCPRFTARVLRNVVVKLSPERIARRLAMLDQRPINNAVDATNYTLWEMGKPTHVFDLDLLEGGKIIVRYAKNGETLKTLDGVERKLTSQDLVVLVIAVVARFGMGEPPWPVL